MPQDSAPLGSKLQQIFRDLIAIEDFSYPPETVLRDLPNWDSLNHINLILALEAAFQIHFTTAEMAEMASLGDLYRLLERHGIALE